MPKYPPLEGILFDFDGVLAYSAETHYVCWNNACLRLFSHPLSRETLEHHRGGASPMIAEAICRSMQQPTLQAQALLQEKTNQLRNHISSITTTTSMHTILTFLSQGNIPWGVVSNAPEAILREFFQFHKITPQVLSGFDSVSAPKPSPKAYQESAIRLGVTPAHFSTIYVFEDSLPGITAAKKAGHTTVAVGDALHGSEGELHTKDVVSFFMHYFNTLRTTPPFWPSNEKYKA